MWLLFLMMFISVNNLVAAQQAQVKVKSTVWKALNNIYEEEGYQELEYLLASDIELDLEEMQDGMTPLTMAVRLRNNLVPLLLTRGAHVNAPDGAGKTPLVYAVIATNIDIARILLNAGANCNLRDNEEFTPLLWAFSPSKPSDAIISLLINYHADLAAKTLSQATALSLARAHNAPSTVSLLLTAGAPLDIPLEQWPLNLQPAVQQGLKARAQYLQLQGKALKLMGEALAPEHEFEGILGIIKGYAWLPLPEDVK